MRRLWESAEADNALAVWKKCTDLTLNRDAVASQLSEWPKSLPIPHSGPVEQRAQDAQRSAPRHGTEHSSVKQKQHGRSCKLNSLDPKEEEAIFVKRIDQFVSKTFSDEEIAAAESEVERRFQYRFNKDPDCIQIPQFVPIKLELIELFKYWYTKDIEHVLESYVFSMSTSEHFVSWLSDLRCDQISDLLAVDEITRARAEVEEHFRKGLGGGIKFRDERDWDIFFHGTEEQRADLIERIQRAFEVSG
jgi:hypothetical protein